ncbi:sigma-54 dependent transcriptional regulator [Geobacter sp.]|uniref:sigma-54 dependent transcriptional regulator n=1 Tax=Geobacter sp. TaxID=46610 RepID=UPI00260AA75D|nr:sigma-54 dependent transcriptional regulator [Geobacter sp.]
MVTRREILILSLDERPHLPAGVLESQGWDLRMATNSVDAKAAIGKGNLHVGLVHCADFHESTLETIEDVILSRDTMEWVALVPAAGLQTPEAGRFVMENFHDFHTLPVDPMRLVVTLGHAYGKAALKSRLDSPNRNAGGHRMVGTSSSMQELYQNMCKMQGSDSPILITGESGTGKELVAQAIHSHSPRRQWPFVAVNCGALPTPLIQSELFGHEKGAFTGAFQRKIGRIEAAARGTVFLDEIGELPLELQVNLLRFLQEKTVERIGSNRVIPVDARVIAATNVDIEQAVKDGRFREDLYYRLNVLRLKMPPLRERERDIELLAHTCLKEFARKEKLAARGFSKRALRAMYSHPWPGNVRELINRVKRASVMCEGRLITAADLGLDNPDTAGRVLSLDSAREKAECEAIRASLQRTMNNVSEAARQLGVSRVTLYRLMNKFGISA